MGNIEISREEYVQLVDAKVRLDIIRELATSYTYSPDFISTTKRVLGIEEKED